jgi:E3 ubiquitin-protein ligase XIAP/baculoviral IAP repeat-containing protein 2/3
MGNTQDKETAEKSLLLATSRGDAEEVRTLVESGIDVNADRLVQDEKLELSGPPLKIATEQGRLDIIKLLCSYGADVNKKIRGSFSGKRTLLSLAMRGGHPDIVRYLLLRGARSEMNQRLGWYEDERDSPVPYSRNIYEILLLFGMEVQEKDLKLTADPLNLHIESFRLLLDHFPRYKLPSLYESFSNSTQYSLKAKEEIKRAFSDPSWRELTPPKPHEFPFVLMRGLLSYRKSIHYFSNQRTSGSVLANNNSRRRIMDDGDSGFESYFFVLTTEYVLLCFSSPADNVPKEAIFVEDYVNVREGSVAEGCAKSEYTFVLQSLRKQVPTKYFACWSEPVRQAWMSLLVPYFDKGLNFTRGHNDIFSVHPSAPPIEDNEIKTNLPEPSAPPLSLENYSSPSDSHHRDRKRDIAGDMDEDEYLCKICFELKIDSIILPCGHCCSCMECCQALDICPICRTPIDRVVKMYKV